jgi:hypothetical protein
VLSFEKFSFLLPYVSTSTYVQIEIGLGSDVALCFMQGS